eukprot:6966311-Prymnesium_polylepis.1
MASVVVCRSSHTKLTLLRGQCCVLPAPRGQNIGIATFALCDRRRLCLDLCLRGVRHPLPPRCPSLISGPRAGAARRSGSRTRRSRRAPAAPSHSSPNRARHGLRREAPCCTSSG